MNFHSLSRKDLQTLCKKNKIPANMTNLAMADALKALQHVEGLEEFLNLSESDCQQVTVGTQSVPRTATRTSTRQKSVKQAPGSSVVTQIRSRRVTRAVIAEELEQENKDVNLTMTPAVPTTRKRVPEVSTQKKTEMKNGDDESDERKNKINVPETPAVQSSRRGGTVRTASKRMETPNEGNSLQKACSTRRSTRLLEKGIADLSIEYTEQKEFAKTAETSEDMLDASETSHETDEVENGEAGLSFETEPVPFSERSDEVEVRSIEKITEESESNDSESKLDLGQPEGSEVLEISDDKKELDVNKETEGSDINFSCPDIVSHPSWELVNDKRSSSDDSAAAMKCCMDASAEVILKDDTVAGGSLVSSASDESISKSVAGDPNADIKDKTDEYQSLGMEESSFGDDQNLKDDTGDVYSIDPKFSKLISFKVEIDAPGDESDVPAMENTRDKMVEEKDENKDCPMMCTQSEVDAETMMRLKDPMFTSEKPDVEIEPEMTVLTEELKDEGENNASDNVEPETLMLLEACPVKPETKAEPEMTELTEKSEKEVDNIASDNQNTHAEITVSDKDETGHESSLDVQVGPANEDLLMHQLPSQFPRPTFTTPKKSDGEKQAKIICDEEDDVEAESKDTVKEIVICDEFEKLSLGSLRRRIKKVDRIIKSKHKTQDVDLLPKKVDEKRPALLPVQENRMPAAEA